MQVEKWDDKNKSLRQPSGKFRYQEKLTQEIKELLQISRDNQLNDSRKSRSLGEALFDMLFDDSLLHDFVVFYNDVVHTKQTFLN